MKIFKKIKFLLLQNRCKHESVHSASCPYTGNTYVTCTICEKRISIRMTEN